MELLGHMITLGFPGGSVVKNKTKQKNTCQCRGHEFNPWSGKIPPPVGQLSSRIAASEPAL